jgi:very-short-patch-repair endonuclease
MRSMLRVQDRGMSIVAQWVDSLGGFAQKQQLARLGATDRSLTLAVCEGSVRRARQGWYSTVPDDDPRFRAVRCGGRLTGLSAIRALGGWALNRDGVLHVSLPPNASRLRSPRSRRVRLAPRRHGVQPHWDDTELLTRGDSSVVDIRDALIRTVLDEDRETAVAALDWALHTARLDSVDFDRLIRALPERLRNIRDWVDPACESLPESLARTRLRMLGHSVVSQVPIAGAKRIDLVVDGVVGLETDGEEFHTLRFLQDRQKDIDIMLAGFLPLRLPAQIVFWDWQRAVAAVHAVLELRGVGNSGEPRAGPPRRPDLWAAPASPSERGARSPEFPTRGSRDARRARSVSDW